MNQLQENDLAALFDIDLEGDKPEPLQAQLLAEIEHKPRSKTLKKKTLSNPPKYLDIENLTGKQLKKLREDKQLTVLQLAEALSVTAASIYRWEKSSHTLALRSYSKETLKRYIEESCFV